MENLFEHILDDDEKIVKIFKPNKLKLYFSNIFCFSIFLLFFLATSILGILIPEEGYDPVNPIYVLIPIGIFVFIILLVALFTALYYKNVYYVYTNKRIVIRSGIFGVDYKSLDMAMIGAVDVYVSLIDKILKRNTGSLCFGSMASPMVSGKGGAAYKFNHIVMPYETCKEIKVAIDSYKKEVNKKS